MHPDARTYDPDTQYFFLGKDQISAAIQWSRNKEMSPYGLLLMHSERFWRKEGTMLFHPETGLARTMLSVVLNGVRYQPTHERLRVRWGSTDPLDPVVLIEWEAGPVIVTERFAIEQVDRPLQCYVPEDNEAGSTIDEFLVRDVRVAYSDSSSKELPTEVIVELSLSPNPYLFNGLPNSAPDTQQLTAVNNADNHNIILTVEGKAQVFERFITTTRSLQKTESIPILSSYWIPEPSEELVYPPLHFVEVEQDEEEHTEHPESFVERLIRQLEISEIGIRASTSIYGAFDACIWQYGYEWAQDAAMVASAATYAGDFTSAYSVLFNIFYRLTNQQGRVAESSRFRDGELAELNANGAVLIALRDYVALADDTRHIEYFWQEITAIAELLLSDEYLHPCGLLSGRRDLWERLPWMGLREGFDTATNTFCAEGLLAAAEVATIANDKQAADRWQRAGEKMRKALLEHNEFSSIEGGRIIHRRLLDGSVQHEMISEAGYHDERYAPYVPSEVTNATPRPCDPDSTSALPILYGLVNPTSALARNTIDHLHEHLWNPTGIGGYARSPLASDPDSPGPWPFVTAWMAEAELKVGLTERARQSTEWLLTMASEAGSWFEYYGERTSPPYPPLGIIVWGWAQFILLVVRGWMGLEVNTDRIRISPRTTGFHRIMMVGQHYLELKVTGLELATVNGKPVTLQDGAIELSLPITEHQHVVFTE